MRRLIVAIGFLTRLPVPRIETGPEDFAGAVRLYPLVGLLVGSGVAGAGWMGALVDPWFGALLTLVAWVWITGGLHLDGLADLADGLGAAHGDRGRLLAVMADPHIGSFGTIAIALQVMAKLVALHLLLPAAWPLLVAIPAAARVAPLWWAHALPPLKPAGLGAAIRGAVRRRDLAGWAAVLAGGCLLLPTLLIALLLPPLLGLWFRHRIGGMSGDVHGAGIELVETGLLLAGIVALR